jgi:hypothetical protein
MIVKMIVVRSELEHILDAAIVFVDDDATPDEAVPYADEIERSYAALEVYLPGHQQSDLEDNIRLETPYYTPLETPEELP